VVRSVLVPALALDVGSALWWPGRLRRATPRGPAVPDARTPQERQDVQPRDLQPVPAAQAAARAASGDAPDAAARPGPDSAIPVARVAATDEESDSAGV
jgi:hypothetical protein